MSILFGRDHRDATYMTENPYGGRIEPVARLPLAGAADIALDASGALAYVAAKDGLHVIDIRQPDSPVPAGHLPYQGTGRQIAVQDGIAAVTTRPDGLYLCDVRDPARPALLAHYDTVELATGVFLSGDHCFVTCRHMGVEIIDISDPRRPRHISNVLAGEAQSVFVDGRHMYVGAWAEREIVIFDIDNPRQPVRLSVCELDGYGDGMQVTGDLCFAATGHHNRRLANRRKYTRYDFVTPEMLADGYGCGHGLEIFDITDRRAPLRLARLNTPPLFFSSCDMWNVCVCGDHAVIADTLSGVFVVDIAEPAHPRFEGYYRLPVHEDSRFRAEPPIQQPCGPVTGIAVREGWIFAVGTTTGLHILPLPPSRGNEREPVRPYRPSAAAPAPQIPPAFFATNAQVHAVSCTAEGLLVAAGDEGIYTLDPAIGTTLAHCPTEGAAIDIGRMEEIVYVAEGRGGLSVWRLDAQGLRFLSRLRFADAVRQVVVYPALRIAALHLGIVNVQFIDISIPMSPVPLQAFSCDGMMYYKNIVPGLFQGRYAVVAPLSPATLLFDLSNPADIVRVASPYRDLCPIEDGVAIVDQTRMLTIACGGYYCTEGMETRFSREDRLCPPGQTIRGHPHVHGTMLYAVNRQSGLVAVYDIADLSHPRLLHTVDTFGHPEDIVVDAQRIWIPCGHRGLIRLHAL